MPKQCAVSILVAMLWVGSVRVIRGFTPATRSLHQRNEFLVAASSIHRHPVSLFSTKASDNAAKPPKRKGPNTGGLRRLPVVKPPVELMNKARRDAERVKADT